MDLSKIRAVIADDDVFKGFDIRKALEFNGVRNIMTVRNQEKLWDQIYHGEDKIDLIVTDMQYPLEAGEAELQYPRHFGKRMVKKLNDLNSNFKEVLGKLEKGS